MSSSMRRLAFTVGVLLHFISWTDAAPRKFTCITYMEDDKTLGDEDYTYDYSTAGSASGERLANESAARSTTTITTPTTVTNTSLAKVRACPDDYTFCFSLWRQTSNGTHIEKQGCWKESTERNATCSHTECTSSAPTSRNNSLYYCCCSGDVCNQRMSVVEPSPLQLSKNIGFKHAGIAGTKRRFTVLVSDILWVTGLLTAIILTALLAFYHCNTAKLQPQAEESPLAPTGPGYSSNSRNVDNISLVGMLGCGKYGTVMKGILHEQEVAVKIYPETYHQYFVNERNIYSLPLMNCPSLLTYFGYDEGYTLEGKIEYKLVLSLAPLGCLQDWLISNCMNFETFGNIMKSITRGLSHLHTELRNGDMCKPCIAHRDLNSRNILMKADLTCCIADFGFALKVFGSKYEYKGETATAETKSINEVGTLRYMAPELLEGAVNLRDCETALKQMDVYSLGLLLWEVVTRCIDFYASGQSVPTYKAPYELEVGPHPSFDQMQTLVVRHKARPLFPAGWGGGPAAKVIRDTCEDCWDHDAEARLTALCAEERMHEMSTLRPRQHAQLASPLLSANNLVNNISQNASSGGEQIFTSCDIVDGIESNTVFQPPPNQQLPMEKNHLGAVNYQLQPYQGRNPCQERNLAPLDTRIPQVLIEKSKKHSFQNTLEQSLSCLEDDVSVEELISGGSINQASNMGEGFPKKHNTDMKLRGWHGVRAMIHKKLFRKVEAKSSFNQFGSTDDKSNLVEPREGIPPGRLENEIHLSGSEERVPNLPAKDNLTLPIAKRPNNLDLGTLALHADNASNNLMRSTQKGKTLKRPLSSIQSCENHISTPAHALPKSISANNCFSQALQCNSYNNNNNNNTTSKKNNSPNNQNSNELKVLSKCKIRTGHRRNHSTSIPTSDAQMTQSQFRRQHSLEVFREVFSGHGSAERLRDPSQRVKTPGDVPPSVRRARASKTLSLYDDRYMDSSLLNVL